MTETIDVETFGARSSSLGKRLRTLVLIKVRRGIYEINIEGYRELLGELSESEDSYSLWVELRDLWFRQCLDNVDGPMSVRVKLSDAASIDRKARAWVDEWFDVKAVAGVKISARESWKTLLSLKSDKALIAAQLIGISKRLNAVEPGEIGNILRTIYEKHNRATPEAKRTLIYDE